jgi:hemolysin activation/secretion protein
MRIFIVSFFLLVFASVIYKVEAAEAPAEISFTVSGFQVEGDNPLSAGETEAVLEPYQGKHSGLEGLQAASDALQSELGTRGYSFHRVVLPPQTLQIGVVRLQVIEFSLGEIKVENNRYFDEGNVLAALPGLKQGQAPNVKKLSRQLRIANTHPAKKHRLAFNESDRPGVIDATVQVEDRPPGSFFTVLQNTGTEETGDWRLSLGYQYSNLFNRDHSVSLVYTTSPEDTGAVRQVGVSYVIPLYRVAGSLSFLYSDSNVESGVVQDIFQINGAGKVAGVRYQHSFLDWGAYQHEAAIGYEDKLFENDLIVNGQDAGSVADVRTNPVSLTYRGRIIKVQSILGFELTGVVNQPGGSNSDAATYDLARPGADPEWSAIRYALEYSYRFAGDWSVSLRHKGQRSGEPLVAGEQFGLGGAQSIRGFEERELLGDNGWHTNLEIIAPPLGDTGVNLLLFYDRGHLENEDTGTGEPHLEIDPASAGLGLRWLWREQLGLRADAASVLEGAGDTEDGDTGYHFSLFYRF